MATMTYKEQLQHPNWQRKRLEMLEASSFACDECGDTETMLHVHHKKYVKGRKAWEYDNDQLRVLCVTCHETEHSERAILDALLDHPEFTLSDAIGLIAGYIYGVCGLSEELEKAALDLNGYFFDIGTFASIASGSEWKQMGAAAKLLVGSGLTPPQENAMKRWSGADPE